jgi:hypothetical protein
MTRMGPLARLVAVAMASVALTATAGCGDSDDGESVAKDGQSAAQQATDTKPVAGTPDAEIRAVYERYVDAFYAKDVAAVCALFTKKMQKDIGNGTPCKKTLRGFIKSGSISTKRPYVTKVKVKSPASATAWVKTQTSKSYRIPFQKVDGEWKANGGLF